MAECRAHSKKFPHPLIRALPTVRGRGKTIVTVRHQDSVHLYANVPFVPSPSQGSRVPSGRRPEGRVRELTLPYSRLAISTVR